MEAVHNHNLDANGFKRCAFVSKALKNFKDLSKDEKIIVIQVLMNTSSADNAALEDMIIASGLREEISNHPGDINTNILTDLSCNSIKKLHHKLCDGCNTNVISPILLPYSESIGDVGIKIEDDKIDLNGNQFARHILRFYRLAYSQGDRFYLFEAGKWRFIDSNELSRILREFLHSHFKDLWSESLEKKYLNALKREAERIDDFDVQKDYINLQNGMLNVGSCDLKPHSPDYKSSIQIPLAYDPSAECPEFLKFLEATFEGNREIIDVIQELFGYCMSSNTSAQKAFMFYGRGANGKSILSKVLMRLVGEANVSTIPLSELEKPFARFQLVGKTLNLATENEVGTRGISTTHFKSIVGGDPITVEEKFKPSFVYTPSVKMIFSLNSLPKTRDRSYGFQRRLLIIPFNRTFKDSDPDIINGDILLWKLYKELPGILNFSLQGLQRLSANKFVFSKSTKIDEVLNDYLEEINPFFAFVDEKIEEGQASDRLFNDRLVDEFKTWCAANGHQNIAKASNMRLISEIRSALKEKNIDFDASAKNKSGGRRYTAGVKFKTVLTNADASKKNFLDMIEDPEFDSQFFQS